MCPFPKEDPGKGIWPRVLVLLLSYLMENTVPFDSRWSSKRLLIALS